MENLRRVLDRVQVSTLPPSMPYRGLSFLSFPLQVPVLDFLNTISLLFQAVLACLRTFQAHYASIMNWEHPPTTLLFLLLFLYLCLCTEAEKVRSKAENFRCAHFHHFSFKSIHPPLGLPSCRRGLCLSSLSSPS